MPKHLKDFKQQRKNANKHSERGMSALEDSMNKVGFLAPMIVANDDEIISGSARHEVASEVFGPDAEPIVVLSDGQRPIIVKRTDIATADSPKAKQAAIMENRVAELNLAWEPAVMQELIAEMPEFVASQFTAKEMAAVLEIPQEEAELADAQAITSQWVVAITCDSEGHQLELLDEFMKRNLNCKALVS
jgi:hypothetical protein